MQSSLGPTGPNPKLIILTVNGRLRRNAGSRYGSGKTRLRRFSEVISGDADRDADGGSAGWLLDTDNRTSATDGEFFSAQAQEANLDFQLVAADWSEIGIDELSDGAEVAHETDVRSGMVSDSRRRSNQTTRRSALIGTSSMTYGIPPVELRHFLIRAMSSEQLHVQPPRLGEEAARLQGSLRASCARLFHLVALGEHGKILLKKKLSRKQLLALTANLPAGTRRAADASVVKPFLKSNKNDFLDAEYVPPQQKRADDPMRKASRARVALI